MLKMIVAMDQDQGIGFEGGLLKRIHGDLPRFREMTWDHPVIMGRLTASSLPKALPGRENCVVSHNPYDREDFGWWGTKQLSDFCQNPPPWDSWIIGGGQIYAFCLPFIEELYVTHFEQTAVIPDTFFPTFLPDFRAVDRQDCGDHQFVKYVRK